MAAIDHFHAGRLPGFLARVGETYDRFVEKRARQAIYRQTLRELGALTNRDLADLGIHRTMIPTVAAAAAYGGK